MKTWTHYTTDRYDITGVDRSGKRFSFTVKSPFHAMGINLWRGSVWLLRDGKRTLLKRVWN